MSVSCRRALLFIFFILQLSALSSGYASGPGTGSADFLKIPVGAWETAPSDTFRVGLNKALVIRYCGTLQ